MPRRRLIASGERDYHALRFAQPFDLIRQLIAKTGLHGLVSVEPSSFKQGAARSSLHRRISRPAQAGYDPTVVLSLCALLQRLALLQDKN